MVWRSVGLALAEAGLRPKRSRPACAGFWVACAGAAVGPRPLGPRLFLALGAVGVGAGLDVLNEGGTRGLPSEHLARDRARGGHVETDELADEAEARAGLLGRDRGRW